MEYSEIIPIQYEEKSAGFLGMKIYVDERVFIPRPETELLVKSVVDLCHKKMYKRPRILEVGTGSAIISIGLSKFLSESEITAVDISEEALCVAERNIIETGCLGNIRLEKSDMFEKISGSHVPLFDVIVSNPPYVSDRDYEQVDEWVKREPEIALRSGPEGMDHINILAKEGVKLLSPSGFLALEIGYDQAEKVKKLFNDVGFEKITSFRDFNGFERVITGEKKHG